MTAFSFFAAAMLAGSTPPSDNYLPGRVDDARVVDIEWRLAMAGRARCPRTEPTSGLVLQHLSQFQLADRIGVTAALPLDRGPGVIAVVPGAPADNAGLRPGDVLLAINGVALPHELGLALPFDATQAHARADIVNDLLQAAHRVTLLRGNATLEAALTPLPACPSRVHLARSGQLNAFADGRHVFLTTGMLALLRGNDELAFVIAHEMAHNVLGHAAIMRTTNLNRRAVRALESAADVLGAEMMLDAGYDPVAGGALLTRVGGSDFGIALFARHEPVATRRAALRAIADARAGR